MSTEYTPDTEDVAFCYEGPDMDAGERRAGFERWLASVKAEALREAADAYLSEFGTWGGAGQGAWLRARADDIEREIAG